MLPSREDLPWPVRKVVDAWMAFVHAFSWLLARLVVGVLFVVAFPLYRAYLSLSSRDPLREAWEPEAETYWEGNDTPVHSLEDFQRQY